MDYNAMYFGRITFLLNIRELLPDYGRYISEDSTLHRHGCEYINSKKLRIQ
jgi:hypothetical protein